MRWHAPDIVGQARDPRPVFVAAGRPAIVAALGFAAGSALYFSLPAEPARVWALLACLVAIAALIAARAGRSGASVTLGLLLALGLAAGFARAQHRTLSLARGGATTGLTLGRPAPVSGWLEAVERNSRDRSRLSIRLPREAGQPARRVRVLASAGDFVPGDAISVLAVVERPRRAPVPGSYDFRFNAHFAGIVASGFALAPVEAGPALHQDRGVRAIARWRWHIAGHLREALPGRNGAMAAALLTGDRSGLPQEVSASLRAAGLGHVLAISGMHMALFAGGVFLILRFGLAAITPWARRADAARPAAIGALLAGAGYFILSGGAIPTQRAFLMAAAVLTGVLVGRRALSLHTLALAMIFVLALQPEAVRGAGFQMSFAAVAALIASADLWRVFARTRAPLDRQRSGAVKALAGLSTTSLIAGLATSGFAAFHFHRMAGFGLIGNLLAMPVFSFVVMPAGVAALALMPFGLDGPALTVMGWGLDVMFAVADRIAAMPGALQPVIAAPGWVLPLYVAGFVTVLFGRGPVRAGGGAIALIALALWSLAPPPDLFVSEEGVLVARSNTDPHAWAATSRRRGRFAVKVFLEQRASTAPPERAVLQCDDLGCRGQGAGLAYTLLQSPQDWREDCARAELVVLAVDLPVWLQSACSARVLDRARLREVGGSVFWIRDGQIVRAQHVQRPGSDRPWERGGR